MNNTFNGPISGTGGLVINSIEQDIFNGTITYSGPTIINSAALLTISANSSLGSSSLIQLGNVAANIDLSSTPGLMRGKRPDIGWHWHPPSTATSRTAPVQSCRLGVGGPGTLAIFGNLTLAGATNAVDLGSDPNVGNDLVNVSGNLTLSGVNTIRITPVGPLSSASPYTIINYSGTLTGGAGNFQVSSGNPRYTVSVVDPASTPGFIKVSINGVATPIVWKGGKTPGPNVWNHTFTNFFNTGTSAFDQFYDGDVVTFDDTSVTNMVNITEALTPSLINLANNANAYTFMGNGNLGGTLDKEGFGTVTLAISNTLAINYITNNQGVLILNPPLDSTLAAVISDNGSGSGTIVKGGTNLLTLGGDNSAYHGAIVVTNGTLRYAAGTALGASTYLYVTNSGSLDLNDVDAGTKNIAVSGMGYTNQGAIANLTGTWPAFPYEIAHNVTLLGDAGIGSSGRWDISGGTFTGGGYNLTKVGNGQITIKTVGETGLGNIDIIAGNLSFQDTATLGDPTKIVTVESNATLGFWAGANPYNKSNIIVINSTITSGGNTNNLNAKVTLQSGTNYISTSVDFNLVGPIVGTGGFIKQAGGTLWLFGTNIYSGPTTIGQNSIVSVGTNSSLGSSSLIEIDGGST